MLRLHYFSAVVMFLLLTMISGTLASQNQDQKGKSDKTSSVFARLFSLSDEYRLKGDYEKAMQNDFTILRMAEALSLLDETGRAYNNIGINHYRLGSLDQALEYFQKAAGIRMILRDTIRLADTYCNLGMLYDDMGAPELAIKYYDQALVFFSLKHVYDGMADVYNGMAGHYYMQRNIDSVAFFAEKSLKMYEKAGNIEAMTFMLMNISALKNLQGKYSEALIDLQQGIAIADSTGNLNQLRQGYRALSETYSYMGQWEEAYKNYLVYEEYKDSIFTLEKTKVIEDLETRYETQKTKEELSRKKAELLELEVHMAQTRNIRNIVILALIIVVSVALLLWLRYKENKKSAGILDAKNKELAQLNATKDKLFSLISHDLRSPVSSLARLASGLEKSMDLLEKQELKEYIGEMTITTANLNEFLNKLLQWALTQKDGLKPAFQNFNIADMIEDVVRSHKSQADLKKMNLKYECHESLSMNADRAMVETILRNLVSNALKFGNFASTVQINVLEESGFIKISVINSGKGFTENEANSLFQIDKQVHMIENHHERGSGLGLILCSEFAKAQGGTIQLESRTAERTCFLCIFPKKD